MLSVSDFRHFTGHLHVQCKYRAGLVLLSYLVPFVLPINGVLEIITFLHYYPDLKGLPMSRINSVKPINLLILQSGQDVSSFVKLLTIGK